MSRDQSKTAQNQKDNAFEKAMKKLLVSFHRGLFQLSGGRLGTATSDREFLLLTTRGRVSGQERTIPIFFFRDRRRSIIIASNWGSQQHPQWWLNLQADPHARVQIGKQNIEVVASQADGEERARLWTEVTRRHKEFLTYQQGTTRTIPVVILTPDEPGSVQ